MKFYRVREAIKVKYGTFKKFAEKTEMSYTTLVHKLAGESEFTRAEMAMFCELLEIPIEKVWEYFFYA